MVRTQAAVAGGELRCPLHGKRLGRVTPEGLLLWCKGGSHEVLVSRETLRAIWEQHSEESLRAD